MSECGDNDEFVTLLTAGQSDMLAYALSLTGDRDFAQEVVQASNLVIWRKADTFELGTSFLAWAFTIVKRQVLEHRGKRVRDRLVFSAEFVEELSASVAEQEPFGAALEKQEALLECFKDIPESRRELVWLRYRDGLSVADIAERLGKKADATRQMLHRIRVGLMRCVEERLAGGLG